MRALIVIALLASIAHADPSTTLREGNAAASANDWARVAQLVEPLFPQQLSRTDLAEAHRLAGLAAFFGARYDIAEVHFFEYLKLELDGQLDPSAYPPEAISFFENVRQKHRPELLALRPKPKGSVWLGLIPVVGQLQNNEKTKAIIVGAALGTFAITNIATYVQLRRWCDQTSGSGGTSATCDGSSSTDANHDRGARTLRTVNLVSGIATIVTLAYSMYDGVTGYRRRTREMAAMPYVTPTTVGISFVWGL